MSNNNEPRSKCKCSNRAEEKSTRFVSVHWSGIHYEDCPYHTPKSELRRCCGTNKIIGEIDDEGGIHADVCSACGKPFVAEEGCEDCKKDKETCLIHTEDGRLICTPRAPKKTYNRDYSHTHCWNQGKSPACGQPLENHKQCCLCDMPMPKKEMAKCATCGESKNIKITVEEQVKYNAVGGRCFECVQKDNVTPQSPAPQKAWEVQLMDEFCVMFERAHRENGSIESSDYWVDKLEAFIRTLIKEREEKAREEGYDKRYETGRSGL